MTYKCFLFLVLQMKPLKYIYFLISSKRLLTYDIDDVDDDDDDNDDSIFDKSTKVRRCIDLVTLLAKEVCRKSNFGQSRPVSVT